MLLLSLFQLEDELEVPEAGRDYDDRFNSETFGADAGQWELFGDAHCAVM